MDLKEKIAWGLGTMIVFLLVFLTGVMSDVLWFRPDVIQEKVICPRYVVERLKEGEERVDLLEKNADLNTSLDEIKFNQLSDRIRCLEEKNVPQLNFSNVKHISVFNSDGEIMVDTSSVEESGVATK